MEIRFVGKHLPALSECVAAAAESVGNIALQNGFALLICYFPVLLGAALLVLLSADAENGSALSSAYCIYAIAVCVAV